jgi:mannose-6-phosphate isomerase-like protein (cupin superfamily)
MNVIAIEAGCSGYPEHDHAKDGQEEVYVVLGGFGSMEAGGKSIPLHPRTLVRVGPTTKRKIRPGPEGIVVLALGGTPGRAYGSSP